MNKKKDSFIVNRIKSVGFAFKGAYLLMTTEASLKVQFTIGILITVLGFYVGLSATEWCIQILVIAMIMAIEGVNTAIEEIADFIHPEHHPKIGLIKDLAAGAVFIVAIAAIVIGSIIYIPKIF
ncbi:diacylglycerol kinase [Lacinutrix jangbogonensis]|uniref:diacylglycerol kinase n=1 Tax=Lacinutrix jangbogonensis TaxID=1469557 RepID=UPI00053E91B9|nr:diacylglycerol kinase family protein [Lacinutrix jangbogonensis]